jgi:hypothetical protein
MVLEMTERQILLVLHLMRARHSFLNAYAFYGLAIALADGRGIAVNRSQPDLFRKSSKVVASPGGPAEWLNIKYNVLGYLDKECRPSAFIAIRDGEYGQYKLIYSDARAAVSKCMPKSILYKGGEAEK